MFVSVFGEKLKSANDCLGFKDNDVCSERRQAFAT